MSDPSESAEARIPSHIAIVDGISCVSATTSHAKSFENAISEPTLVPDFAIGGSDADSRANQTRRGIAIARKAGRVWGLSAKSLAAKNAAAAVAFAETMRPLLIELAILGPARPSRLARELNRVNIKTPSGTGRWHAAMVSRVLNRIGPAFAEDVAAARSSHLKMGWSRACAVFDEQSGLGTQRTMDGNSESGTRHAEYLL